MLSYTYPHPRPDMLWTDIQSPLVSACTVTPISHHQMFLSESAKSEYYNISESDKLMVPTLNLKVKMALIWLFMGHIQNCFLNVLIRKTLIGIMQKKAGFHINHCNCINVQV